MSGTPRAMERQRESMATASRSLPDDLQERVVTRLGLLTLLLGGAVVAEAAVSFALGELTILADFLGSVVLAVSSLAMFAVIRARLGSTKTLVWIGRVYVVLVAFVISFSDFTDGWWTVGGGGLYGVPMVTCWILLVPMILPSSTATTVILGGVMAIAGGPVALAVVAPALGLDAPSTHDYVDVLASTGLAAAIGIFPARVIHQLGTAIRQARQAGAYRLVERLGEGGMGEVWRAEHDMLARPAAVKIVRPAVLAAGNDEDLRRALLRFEREAQTTASLGSPNTVVLYDYGRTDDGAFYYAMELLVGLDLEQLVSLYGPLPSERVAHLLLQACDSLGEAHAAGLVHRDIKPSNLFVCHKGQRDDVLKVLDFGLVALRDDDADGAPANPALSHPGAVLGTPAYLAPEAVSSNAPPDGRADLYALGAVAYWLLTGRRVFEGATMLAVLSAHLHDAPVPPVEVRADVDPTLSELVLSCLAKTPSGRPASADALAEELRALGLAEAWTPARATAWWDANCPERQAPAASADPVSASAPTLGVGAASSGRR
ncbi:MAG: serine/threonine protein kinase [Sandaracinaceae bacterium]|nr:serine/threonine protein kinase [Sandaracinaceae bacterium]